MGTWDVGPFANDTAADFCGGLDEAAAGEREGIVRGALTRVIDTLDCLEAPESEVAVAALAAAQCPGGEPADSVHGREELLPDLTGLRDLARLALTVAEASELMELWDPVGWRPWRANFRQLQNVLMPQLLEGSSA